MCGPDRRGGAPATGAGLGARRRLLESFGFSEQVSWCSVFFAPFPRVFSKKKVLTALKARRGRVLLSNSSSSVFGLPGNSRVADVRLWIAIHPQPRALKKCRPGFPVGFLGAGQGACYWHRVGGWGGLFKVPSPSSSALATGSQTTPVAHSAKSSGSARLVRRLLCHSPIGNHSHEPSPGGCRLLGKKARAVV